MESQSNNQKRMNIDEQQKYIPEKTGVSLGLINIHQTTTKRDISLSETNEREILDEIQQAFPTSVEDTLPT